MTTSQEESVRLLQRLIRIDTSNPPGNETACALALRDYLRGAGIDSRLLGEAAKRQNIIARLRGSRPGPTLALLAHMDVVPAVAEQWTAPPFSGQVRDGHVWGRGALDAKSQLAAHAVALARLARSGCDLAGDVLFIGSVDEEQGDQCGARWLVTEHIEQVACDYLLTEGGLGRLSVADRSVLPFTVGEKGVVQFRINVEGTGGHAALPLHDLNPIERLGHIITALANHESPVTLLPVVSEFIGRVVTDGRLATLLRDPAEARTALREMRAADPSMARLLEPLLGVTFSPTVVSGGGPAMNVIPHAASVTVDCRVLPGQDPEAVWAEVDRALQGHSAGYRLEPLQIVAGNESPADSPLRTAMESALRAVAPNAQLVPTYLCGFTDASWFREALPGLIAYGFCPCPSTSLHDVVAAEHGTDERILVADVLIQALFFERVARTLLS